jgi:hypothetical protein
LCVLIMWARVEIVFFSYFNVPSFM